MSRQSTLGGASGDVILCGRPCRTGRPCGWALPCSLHGALEVKDMEREDTRSALVLNGRQCSSCLDAYPDKRCSNVSRIGSDVCAKHLDFPKLGLELQRFAKHCRDLGCEFSAEAFVAACYPSQQELPPGNLTNLAQHLLRLLDEATNKRAGCGPDDVVEPPPEPRYQRPPVGPKLTARRAFTAVRTAKRYGRWGCPTGGRWYRGSGGSTTSSDPQTVRLFVANCGAEATANKPLTTASSCAAVSAGTGRDAAANRSRHCCHAAESAIAGVTRM